jgi:hypothetical protein
MSGQRPDDDVSASGRLEDDILMQGRCFCKMCLQSSLTIVCPLNAG